jgi:hypothetical protein
MFLNPFPSLPISITSGEPLWAGSADVGPADPFTLGRGRLGPGERATSFGLLCIIGQPVTDTLAYMNEAGISQDSFTGRLCTAQNDYLTNFDNYESGNNLFHPIGLKVVHDTM